MGKITSKEIAKLAGVSTSAVSIVLNNKPGVSDETREHVLNILAKNGITPKGLNKSTGVIRFCKIVKHGEIINDKHNVFLSDYIDGIVEEAKSNECVVEFASYNTSDIVSIIPQLQQASNLIGLVILSTELSFEDVKILSNLDIPKVFLDAIYEFLPASFITMDNQGMVYE
ncbi:MAG: LacI family DNA-binding transcriptional regulator, partial [Spirochaetales bacterium]|nr:LacI family DNA-binding transcriptional regulator [Spirochaetales bacterium]